MVVNNLRWVFATAAGGTHRTRLAGDDNTSPDSRTIYPEKATFISLDLHISWLKGTHTYTHIYTYTTRTTRSQCCFSCQKVSKVLAVVVVVVVVGKRDDVALNKHKH